MRLHPHPAGPPGVVRAIESDLRRQADGRLGVSFSLDAELARLNLPPAGRPERADGLWRHTCFEVFFSAAGARSYCELNFSPSGAWAAYAFDSYRAGMRPLDLAEVPSARWVRSPQQLTLRAQVNAACLLPEGAGVNLHVALSAVVEEQSGTITYWALQHPAASPDFHHRGGFILEVPGIQVAGGQQT